MSEFLLDWNDASMGLESPHHGIPIPRSQHSQTYMRPDFSTNNQSYLFDNDSPSPRLPLVPPNSLVMSGASHPSSQFGFTFESQRGALSPTHFTGSPLMPSSKVELDMEIKMEPLEDLLDIGGVINPQETPHPPPEDNLLDNVNFEDLLMADDMDSSQTPCLDPQHSSPAAMAAVHPDEVFGLMRTDPPYHPVHLFTPSVSVPVKAENATFGGLATSFPPQGIGWKHHPLPNQSPANSSNQAHYQPLANAPTQQQPRSFIKDSPQYPSRLLVSLGKFSPQDHQPTTPTYHTNNNTGSPTTTTTNNINNNNDEKPFYTQLESASNTSSALHDLLISSPSTSLSPQQPHQLQLSPQSTGTNLSPVSPLRGLSQDIPIGQSVPGAPSFLTARSSSLSSRLSSSAPVNDFSLEQIWQRREPRQHLLSTGSLAEEVGGSTSSLSTGGGILSPVPHDLSIDEGIDSDDDSDVDHYDSDSDNDSTMSEDMTSLGGSGSKKERHFWQYNVQAKGPKGQRVNITQKEGDPHQLAKIMDPVFSPLCSIQGIKHSGKARRGDGNDLTPSPRKLVSIGLELSKLNKKINEMTPVSELPSTVRSKSRKEKNKLASRACRLKKKAQHEANKIKLYGLEQEHQGMLNLIVKMREELLKKVDLVRNPGAVEIFSQHDSSPRDSFLSLGSPGETPGATLRGSSSGGGGTTHLQQILTSHIERAAKMKTKQRIAGFTTEFVNKVIENCRNGNPSGGLDELSQTFAKTSLFSSEGIVLTQNNEAHL